MPTQSVKVDMASYVTFTSYYRAQELVLKHKKDFTAILGILDSDCDSSISYEKFPKHLFLQFHDINHAVDGMQKPNSEQVTQIIEFCKKLTQEDRLLIHCFAGMSRSAACFLIAKAYTEGFQAEKHIKEMYAIQPFAQPNSLILTLASVIDARFQNYHKLARTFKNTQAIIAENVKIFLP